MLQPFYFGINLHRERDNTINHKELISVLAHNIRDAHKFASDSCGTFIHIEEYALEGAIRGNTIRTFVYNPINMVA